jgi:hypothetical protein
MFVRDFKQKLAKGAKKRREEHARLLLGDLCALLFKRFRSAPAEHGELPESFRERGSS